MRKLSFLFLVLVACCPTIAWSDNEQNPTLDLCESYTTETFRCETFGPFYDLSSCSLCSAENVNGDTVYWDPDEQEWSEYGCDEWTYGACNCKEAEAYCVTPNSYDHPSEHYFEIRPRYSACDGQCYETNDASKYEYSCYVGYYHANYENDEDCVPCPPGTFGGGGNATECTHCDEICSGYAATSPEGSTRADQCCMPNNITDTDNRGHYTVVGNCS